MLWPSATDWPTSTSDIGTTYGLARNVAMIADADQVRALFEDTVSRLMPILLSNVDAIGRDPDSFVPGLESRIAQQLARDDQSR